MTEEVFTATYGATLDQKSLANIHLYRPWDVSPLPMPLVLLTLKDHLLAFDYVLQPVDAPKYLQVWEILKNLLALQAGDGAGAGTVCIATPTPPGINEDASEDEFDTSEDEPDAAGGEPEAPEEYGRSEFVLVRVPGTLKLPVRRGLNVVDDGATPLLVGEVKTTVDFDRDIWKPLSFALELMQRNPSQQPQSMWVFVTCLRTSEFVRVDRLPCGKFKAGGASASGGSTAASGATAGTTTVPNTGTVGGAAAGATAAGSVPGGTKASAVKFAFQRFKPVFVPGMEVPDDSYLQLLAILHHIIYPEEQLEDLPARVSRSSEARQARARAWFHGYAEALKRAKEQLAAAGARAVAAEAKTKDADEARAEALAEALAEVKAAAEARAEALAEAKAAAEARAEALAEVRAAAEARATVLAEARAAAEARATVLAEARAAAEARAMVLAEARATVQEDLIGQVAYHGGGAQGSGRG